MFEMLFAVFWHPRVAESVLIVGSCGFPPVMPAGLSISMAPGGSMVKDGYEFG